MPADIVPQLQVEVKMSMMKVKKNQKLLPTRSMQYQLQKL